MILYAEFIARGTENKRLHKIMQIVMKRDMKSLSDNPEPLRGFVGLDQTRARRKENTHVGKYGCRTKKGEKREQMKHHYIQTHTHFETAG